MAEVVALAIEPGPDFVAALERVWEAGDAAAPIDPRLPDPFLRGTLAALRPTAIIGVDGERRQLDDGVGTEAGDAVVLTTSGTAGTPKGVVLTHRALESAAYASMSYLGHEADSCWLGCLPVHHVGGFSVVSRALVCGTGLVLQPRFDPAAVEAAANDGANLVSLVPTTLRRVRSHLFRRILLGGSTIPAERPANTVATYGMTESGAGVVYEGLALNGVALRIEPDGTISLRGPTMLRCYRDGVDPMSADGWFHTGDVGSIDADTGRLTVAGRIDDLIITGGENVWPDPVERIIATDPTVAEVAVIGRPHPEWGQLVTAVVVPADPSDLPDLDRLRARVKLDLPAWCAPRAIEFIDQLPRTSLGKIVRRRL